MEGWGERGSESIATYREIRITLEHLDWGSLASIVNIPVVDGRLGDQAEGGVADPLPVLDVLIHSGGLEFLLLLEVEDL